MSRVKKLLVIYLGTLVLGSMFASFLLSGFDKDVVIIVSSGLLFSFAVSLPALAITAVAHWKLRDLDNYSYFRMMMRVLLGVLVATYVGLLAFGIFIAGNSELQRAYLIYSAVAVAMTFYLLKPKKKS